MYILLLGNIGLLLAIRHPPPADVKLVFLIGIAFNSLIGVIAEPSYQYLTGLFAFAAMFSAISIDNAVASGLMLKRPVR
jgi:hypothetical protein